jgi:plastocyanin
MRLVVDTAAVVLCLVAASCGGAATGPGTASGNPGGSSGGASTPTVMVGTNAFTPDQITVVVNQTVTWKWDSCSDNYGYGGQTCVAHTVTFDAGGGSNEKSEGTFTRTFSSPGTYSYYCTIHGRAYMSGRVVVQ